MTRGLKYRLFVIVCCVLGAASGAKGEQPPAPSVKTYKQNFFLHGKDSKEHSDGRESEETQFQISLKFQPFDDFPLYLGYTQKSFWQMYDSDRSRPFRENNFNPEGFFDWYFPGDETDFALQLGAEHESNGRGFEFDASENRNLNKSRSWNRVYLHPKLKFEGQLSLALKLWHRIEEDEKAGEDDPDGDDNPDIEKYLGHGELRLATSAGNGNYQFLSMIRKGRWDPHGTIQLDFLLNPDWLKDAGRWFSKGMYIQLHYFNGFGESLIDYDRRVKKVGIGFAAGNPFASMFPR